jgi:hypothetical protein
MANAICGNEHSDPDLYDLAMTIARWQIVLLEVRRLKQRVPTDEASAPLDRYERRALSHRNRAIRMFDAISIAAPFLDRREVGGGDGAAIAVSMAKYRPGAAIEQQADDNYKL